MLFTIFAVVLAVIVVGARMLRYRRRSVGSILSSVIVTVTSAVLSCVLARVIASALSGTVVNVLQTAKPDLMEQLEVLPTTLALLPVLISMILAPILFIILMLVLRGLLSIAGIFITKGFEAIGDFFKKPNLAINLTVAALTGLLICAIYLAPLVGFSSVAHGAIEKSETENGPAMPTIVTMLDDNLFRPAADSPVSAVLRVIGGAPVFHSLTTWEFEGADISLDKEAEVIAEAGFHCSSLLTVDFADYGPKEADEIRELEKLFTSSELVCVVGSEVFRTLSNAWLADEPFFGVPPIKNESAFMDQVVDGVLYIFKDTTAETFPEDMTAFSETLAVITETGLLAAIASEDGDILLALQTDGALEAVIISLYDNEPSRPLLATILNVCTEIVAESLGIYEDPTAAQQAFAKELAALSTAGLSEEETYHRVLYLRDRYNVAWTDEECLSVAKSLIENPYAGEKPVSTYRAPDMIGLSTTEEDPLLAWLNSMTKDASVPEAKPNLITREDIRIDPERIADIDRDKLVDFSKEIPAVLGTLSGDGEGKDMFGMVGALGPVLDILDGIPANNEQKDSVAENFLVGVLQSNTAQSTIGITPGMAQSMLNDVFASKELEGTDFTEMMGHVSTLVELVTSSKQNDTEAGAKMAELAREIIRDMDASSALLIQSLVSEDMLRSTGIDDAKAQVASQMVSAMLDAILECRSTLSEAEYNSEADTVASLIRMMTGGTNATPDELFTLVLRSKIFTNVLERCDVTFIEDLLAVSGTPEKEAHMLAGVVTAMTGAITECRNSMSAEAYDQEVENIATLIKLFSSSEPVTAASFIGPMLRSEIFVTAFRDMSDELIADMVGSMGTADEQVDMISTVMMGMRPTVVGAKHDMSAAEYEDEIKYLTAIVDMLADPDPDSSASEDMTEFVSLMLHSYLFTEELSRFEESFIESMLLTVRVESEDAKTAAKIVSAIALSAMECKEDLPGEAYIREVETVCDFVTFLTTEPNTSLSVTGMFNSASGKGVFDLTVNEFAQMTIGCEMVSDACIKLEDLLIEKWNIPEISSMPAGDRSALRAALDGVETDHPYRTEATRVIKNIFGI